MIQLYIRKGCPFCEKVELFAERLGLNLEKDYQLIDAAPNTPGRDKVLQLGGKAMVPFLVDGDISMYESDDIINYLKNKFDE